MSAKKTTKTPTVPDTIILTEAEKGWKEVKALLKKREEVKRKAEVTAKLPEVLAQASKTFGKEFKTLKALVNFVEKKFATNGGDKRAKKLTDDQKTKIRELGKEGKAAKEIATDVGCTAAQVYGVLGSKK
jgi:hypothetical protein